MRVCDIEFVVFTDCESCTRPISTNPGSIEALEYGLTRGTCLLACRPRVGRVRRAAVDFVVCFGGTDFCAFFSFFFSSNAHGLLQV